MLNGSDRADYGKKTVNSLAKNLTEKYGKGYTKRALYQYLEFYRKFPQIVYSGGTKSDASEIVYSASTQSVLLSWTHYRVLLQVTDENARLWYAKEALEQTWSVKTLQRNVSSQYYYRLLKTQDKDSVDTLPQGILQYMRSIGGIFAVLCSLTFKAYAGGNIYSSLLNSPVPGSNKRSEGRINL